MEQGYLLTALCLAAKRGDIEQVKQLIADGADPKADYSGQSFGSALDIAWSSGNRELVRVLVDAGAKGCPRTLESMLFQAVIDSDDDLLSLAEVAGISLSESTILLDFAAFGEEECVRYLLSHGASQKRQWEQKGYSGGEGESYTNRYCMTALHEVCRAKRTSRDDWIAKLIALTKGIDAPAQSGGNRMDVPIVERMRVANLLLLSDADINDLAKYEGGQGTPFDFALEFAKCTGNMELADFLCAKGAKTGAVVTEEAKALQKEADVTRLEVYRKTVETSASDAENGKSAGCISVLGVVLVASCMFYIGFRMWLQ